MAQRKKGTLSYGKLHSLNMCSNDYNTFNILALDHRSVLKKALGHAHDPNITFTNISSFKKQIVSDLSNACSAVLLDPAYGLGPAIGTASFPSGLGLIVSVEKSGYAGDKHNRYSRLGDDWGVESIKRIGANAVKLLIYYHPESPKAGQMRQLLEEVGALCVKHDILLFLETLSFSLDANQSSLSTSEKRRIVIQTAKDLTPLGGEVYKTEFPVNVNESTDKSEWREACDELTEASQIPWVLLSAGVNFETYARQTEVACQSGAAGILAGRAIWKEAVEYKAQDRSNFLHDVALSRMQELEDICKTEARPWTEWYEGSSIDENWFEDYHLKGIARHRR
jgi:tagatose 1,6-diphosphate aldolase